MVSNSECVVMLNQSMRDTEKLTQLFHISDDQARYITNAQAGSGLLRYARHAYSIREPLQEGYGNCIG